MFLRALAVIALGACICVSAPAVASEAAGVTGEMLLDAQELEDRWITYGRNYAGWRYFPGDQINKDNVKRLVPKWVHQTGVAGGGFETTAVVFDGKLYITTPNSHLVCVDAKTGQTLWRYDHPLPPVNLCCGPVNRGVAIRGNKIYYTTLDAMLHCFDKDTGLQLWERRVADYRASYSLTLAPLIVEDKVIVGVAGGEYGIRGHIDAYHVDSGEPVWRFYTIPAEGEPGNDSWAGDSWERGGAPAWVTGTYDPDLNTLYWGTGNPSPDFNGAVREGDNLYSNTILALDADTGKLRWHFQTTPHDVFDLDGTSEPILVDEEINGKQVKALVQVNRNGYVYALDRTNGDFLYAKPYSRVNWAKYDESGIPVIKPELVGNPLARICPGIFGGKNWPPAAYSPKTHFVYTPDQDRCTSYATMEVEFRRGLPYYGGVVFFPPEDRTKGFVKAVDVRTGEIAWEFETPGGPNWGGVLATGGGLVFSGGPDGYIRAFDDTTGEVRWQYHVGSGVFAPPTMFTLDEKAYLGLAVGWGQPHDAIGTRSRETGPGGSAYFLFGLFED